MWNEDVFAIERGRADVARREDRDRYDAQRLLERLAIEAAKVGESKDAAKPQKGDGHE